MRPPQDQQVPLDDVPRLDWLGDIAEPESARANQETGELQRQLAEAQEALCRLQRYVPAAVAQVVLHNPERLRGERRQVAVLFADAVNFTHFSESLDAEAVFDLINDLMGRLVVCIHRYGGMVDKFTGDGLMAIFGAPIAHENNAEMALRAALDMQQAAVEFDSVARAQLGTPLPLRIGIHYGPVVAGILGTTDQAAYTVIGSTVNLASRIQSLARPGHILVSERVCQQLQAVFQFEDMGVEQVKGVSERVAVFEVIGERSQPLATRGVAGVRSAILGRDAELQQLRDLFTAFGHDPYGRLVIVRGEAGIGKSRLVTEALSALPTGLVSVWHGGGVPYAQGVSYGLFRSMLQDAWHSDGIEPGSDEQTAPELRPFLRQVLALPLTTAELEAMHHLEPERIKQLTFLAMREWLLAQARRRPVVLILDDVHWADDLALDMLRSLIDVIYQSPIVFCILTRPQPDLNLDAGPSPLAEPPSMPLGLELSLEPLSMADCRLLLAHLVDLRGLPESLIETILTRSQGYPFYIEEFVRMLIEKDVLTLGEDRWQIAPSFSLQTLDIPTSLQGLMLARVDRLPQDLQEILRTAAVIGPQFPVGLLAQVRRQTGEPTHILPALERLQDAGLIVEQPQPGEQSYAFRHILTQEAVYGSLLLTQRPDMHRFVAESIELLYDKDLDNQAEALAFHYDQARVRDKALRYALLAGDRARARFANRGAITYYARALQLSQHFRALYEERWRAAIGLGEVEQHVGEYEASVACYQAALDEWSEAPAYDRAHAMLRLAQVLDKQGHSEQADQMLHQALAELDRSPEARPALRAEIHAQFSSISRRRGDLAVAQQWLTEALDLAQDSGDFQVLSLIYNRLGALHYLRGEIEQATTHVRQSLAIRERLGDIVGYARSLNNLAILDYAIGEWDDAQAHLERAVELHERMGEVEGLALACTNLGVLYTERGEWPKAEQYLLRSFALAQHIAHPYELAQAHANLGWLHMLRQQWQTSAQHLNMAISLYEQAGARANPNLNDTLYCLGILALEQGQEERAADWAERSHALLKTMTDSEEGQSTGWGQHARLMGRIAYARGDLEAALHHLELSVAILHATGPQIEIARSVYWLARLCLELDRLDKAAENLDAARQIFDRLGASADLHLVQEQMAHLNDRKP